MEPKTPKGPHRQRRRGAHLHDHLHPRDRPACLSLRSRYPVVLPTLRADHAFPAVVPSEIAGGQSATEHLIRNGHTRVGDHGRARISAAQDRLKGYRRALARTDIPFGPELVADGNWSASSPATMRPSAARAEAPAHRDLQHDRMAISRYEALKGWFRIPRTSRWWATDDEEISRHLHPRLRPRFCRTARWDNGHRAARSRRPSAAIRSPSSNAPGGTGFCRPRSRASSSAVQAPRRSCAPLQPNRRPTVEQERRKRTAGSGSLRRGDDDAEGFAVDLDGDRRWSRAAVGWSDTAWDDASSGAEATAAGLLAELRRRWDGLVARGITFASFGLAPIWRWHTCLASTPARGSSERVDYQSVPFPQRGHPRAPTNHWLEIGPIAVSQARLSRRKLARTNRYAPLRLGAQATFGRQHAVNISGGPAPRGLIYQFGRGLTKIAYRHRGA